MSFSDSAVTKVKTMKIIDRIIYNDDMTVLCKCPEDKTGTVVVPEGTLGIRQHAFNGCKIDGIVLPSTLRRIGREAFANCQLLKGIKIPDGLEYLGQKAFENCLALSYVILPGSLTKLLNSTFSGCMMLKYVQFPESGLAEISDNCFIKCYNLESIKIPSSVAKIGKAFCDCWSLKNVIIKSTAIDVNQNAFERCAEELKIVKTYRIKRFFRESNKNKKNNMDNAGKKKTVIIRRMQFCGIKDNLKLRVPDNIVAIEEYAFYKSTGLNEIQISGKIKTISRFAFAGCSGLSVLTFDEGVEKIEESAFEGCTALTSLVLPNSIKEIGRKAFCGCTSLRQITLPKNAVVAENAFEETPAGMQLMYSEDFNSKK